MFTSAGEPGAVAWTLDLYEALGATAYGADLLAEGRTAAARAPRTAKRTQHSAGIIVQFATIPEELIGMRLATSVEAGDRG
jgi:hypothetical protein